MALRRALRHKYARSISFVLACAGCLAAHAADSPDDAFLNALQGKWSMVGMIGSKPVRYSADGQRVLQGGFVRLHMIDTGSPPQYEADVFIGFDPQAHEYIVHWLDRFGAAGARVVAHGSRTGNQLVMIFPYEEGPFRDTLTWRPATESWSLLLESGGPSGTWSTFASYTLTSQSRGAKQ